MTDSPELPIGDGASAIVEIAKHGGTNRLQVINQGQDRWQVIDTTHFARLGVLTRSGDGYVLEAPRARFSGSDWMRLISDAL